MDVEEQEEGILALLSELDTEELSGSGDSDAAWLENHELWSRNSLKACWLFPALSQTEVL